MRRWGLEMNVGMPHFTHWFLGEMTERYNSARHDLSLTIHLEEAFG
jgi:hypothetical protein